MSAKPEANYYQEQLRRDPTGSAESIVGRRAKAFQLKNRSPDSRQPVRSPQLTAKVQAAIDGIRAQFWQLPLDELQSRLAAIDVNEFPELTTAIYTLKRAADAREDFPKLISALKNNLLFFDYLKRSISANPRDLAGIKEMVVRGISLTDKARQHKRAAQIIKSNFPSIYAIDPAWFDEILKMKSSGGTRFSLPTLELPIPGWVIGIILYTVIKGCAAAMR